MTSRIDLEAITAIDFHTHATSARPAVANGHAHDEQFDRMRKNFGSTDPLPATIPQTADYYRERKMAAVAFTVDQWSRTAEDPSPSNDEVLGLASEHADVLIPFASVDPARGLAGVREAERLIETYGVRGFKFHPSMQQFFPNDPAAYPLYEVLQAHGCVALFHSGQTGVGSGVRGGAGIRLKYSAPMPIDDLAVDFPDLPIVLAHPSKYFPPILVQYANSLLKHKVLFGSDFPLLTPDRWLADLETTAIKDEVKEGIFKGNARPPPTARPIGLIPRTTTSPARMAATKGTP